MRVLVSVRLALGTLLLLGLCFAGAGVAQGVGVEMLARPDLPLGVAAVVVVGGSGLLAGGLATAILAHRRAWEAGLTMAIGIMLASIFLSASDPRPPSGTARLLVLAAAASMGLVAMVTAMPTAWLLRFLGRFDHLLPWRAR